MRICFYIQYILTAISLPFPPISTPPKLFYVSTVGSCNDFTLLNIRCYLTRSKNGHVITFHALSIKSPCSSSVHPRSLPNKQGSGQGTVLLAFCNST